MILFGLTNLTIFYQLCLFQLPRTFVRGDKTPISISSVELECSIYLLLTVIDISSLSTLTVTNRIGINLTFLKCTYFCLTVSSKGTVKSFCHSYESLRYFSQGNTAASASYCCFIPSVVLFFEGFISC